MIIIENKLFIINGDGYVSVQYICTDTNLSPLIMNNIS